MKVAFLMYSALLHAFQLKFSPANWRKDHNSLASFAVAAAAAEVSQAWVSMTVMVVETAVVAAAHTAAVEA